MQQVHKFKTMEPTNLANQEQQSICTKYDADFLPAPPNLKAGISLNVQEGLMPLNGIRYQPEEGTSGWFIWAGEEFSEATDFFVSMHIEHLKEFCPLVIKYLGLSPGWRFLVDGSGYEDVWRDEPPALDHILKLPQ